MGRRWGWETRGWGGGVCREIGVFEEGGGGWEVDANVLELSIHQNQTDCYRNESESSSQLGRIKFDNDNQGSMTIYAVSLLNSGFSLKSSLLTDSPKPPISANRGFSNPTPFASLQWALVSSAQLFTQTLLSFMAESKDSSVPVSAVKGEPKCNQMKHGDTKALPIYSGRKEGVPSIVKGDIQPS